MLCNSEQYMTLNTIFGVVQLHALTFYFEGLKERCIYIALYSTSEH